MSKDDDRLESPVKQRAAELSRSLVDVTLADSFTATLSKHKPPVFLEETGGLWFLASEKSLYGTDRGLGLYLAAQKEPAG